MLSEDRIESFISGLKRSFIQAKGTSGINPSLVAESTSRVNQSHPPDSHQQWTLTADSFLSSSPFAMSVG